MRLSFVAERVQDGFVCGHEVPLRLMASPALERLLVLACKLPLDLGRASIVCMPTVLLSDLKTRQHSGSRNHASASSRLSAATTWQRLRAVRTGTRYEDGILDQEGTHYV